MEKLKSILKLKFIKEMPRENKMAYLISVGMGMGVGILVMVIPSFLSSRAWYESSIITSVALAPVIIALIILLLILFNKFPIVQNNIRVRFICITLMLISYIYIYEIIAAIQVMSISQIITIPLRMPVIFFFDAVIIFFEPTRVLLSAFVYLGVFIIIAAYLATKGITNLPKRIILFLIIGFLIYVAAITPLIQPFC